MNHSRFNPDFAGQPPSSRTIGFRLDNESYDVLSHRAAELKVSPHELARHYVLLLLSESEDRQAWYKAVEALHGELGGLRTILQLAVKVLLSAAGRVSKEDAHAWVEGNLK